ncbi:MAG: Flagellar biosynthetic protein FlhB [Holosporales bacterium]
MQEGENNNEDKSEEPTHRRLEKAKEEGQAPFSKELITLSLLVSSFLCVLFVLPPSARYLVKMLYPFVDRPDSFSVDGAFVVQLMKNLHFHAFIFLLPTFLILIISVLACGLYQKWGALSFKSITPKLSNLSFSKGIKKIFSVQNLIENIKNFIKISCLLAALYYALKDQHHGFQAFKWFSIKDFFKAFENFNMMIYGSIILAFLIIAGGDYIYQRFQHYKKLKMSKYEVKKEYKESEGNPEIKAKIRNIRMKMINQKMMENVQKATVVLANPTHFAIALLWDEHTMNAPKVVAKGQDFMAQKIKEIAKDNNVPVIENPSLTRALYEVVDIEDEIPPKYYKAVAEVIKIVMRLKR